MIDTLEANVTDDNQCSVVACTLAPPARLWVQRNSRSKFIMRFVQCKMYTQHLRPKFKPQACTLNLHYPKLAPKVGVQNSRRKTFEKNLHPDVTIHLRKQMSVVRVWTTVIVQECFYHVVACKQSFAWHPHMYIIRLRWWERPTKKNSFRINSDRQFTKNEKKC